MHLRIPHLLCLAVILAVPAAAQTKRAPAHHPDTASAPKEIGTFGDWIAATHGDGPQMVCYALTRAQNSVPKLPSRGEVVLTVSERPTVRDTVAIEAGFDYPPKATVSVQVAQTGLDFYTRGSNAYARDSKAAVTAFQRGDSAIARSPGPHKEQVTDTFSLKGFSAAYAAVAKACPEKK